jgi:hypothetical protein
MISKICLIMIGSVIGAVSTWFIIGSAESPLDAPGKQSNSYTVISWGDQKDGRQQIADTVQIQARVWIANGSYFLLDPTTTEEGIMVGEDPLIANPQAYGISDQLRPQIDWTMKSCNGGIVTLSGLLDRTSRKLSWLLGDFTRVDHIDFERGLSVDLNMIEKNAAHYHDKVIRIAGRVTTQPFLSGLALSVESSTKVVQEPLKLLSLAPVYAPHDDSNFSALEHVGANCIVEGVYAQPFRGTPEMLLGSIMIVHRVINR